MYIRKYGAHYYLTHANGLVMEGYKPCDTYPEALALYRRLTSRPPVVPSYKSMMTTSSNEVAPPDFLTDEQRQVWQRTYDRVFELTQDITKSWLAAMGMVRRLLYRLPVKSIDETKDILIGGWMILFGSPVFKDRLNTFFGEQTDYALDYFREAPLWYDHGKDEAYKGSIIGRRASYQIHAGIGIWVEHYVYASHPLFARTRQELDNGLLAYSSDSLAHFVALGLTQDGNLSLWAAAGCSLTKVPAEPGLGIVVQLDELTQAA